MELTYGRSFHMAVGPGMAALIAGASIANLASSTEIITKVATVKDFFITLFFVALGISIPAPESIDVVVLALAFAAELSGGAEGGPLGRLGWAAVLAAGLAAVPLLASLLAGVPAVFGRRIRVGDVAEMAGRSGRVETVSLLEVRLQDREGGEVRVSHLAALLHPVRVSAGPGLPGRAEVTVASDADPERVRALLLEAGGEGAAAELLALDASGARWSVRGPAPDLGARAASALRAAGVRLGGRP